ncbi:MAG: thiamine pyrophosphate-dependent enzyme [Saprospiraceae bacterium]
MKLTGGQAVVRSLIKEGVDTVFGIPGVQNDWLYNAFYDYRAEINVIHTRHEQGAGYMALGYNLASGKVGVANIVPGPGFLNSSAALATAWGLNAKVLSLVGQIPQKAQGKGRGVLHEIPDQLAIQRQLTKWANRATTPAEVPTIMAQAFHQLQNGRPRPVGVEVSMDVLSSEMDLDFGSYKKAQRILPEIDEEQLDKAIQLIAKAKKPLIFVSGGAMEAGTDVQALAEYLQAPTFAYRTGKGILSNRHYLSFPVPAAHNLWKEADVVIGIGSHVRMPLSKWGVDKDLTFISINIDETAHNRIVEPTVSVTADAAQAIQAILAELPKISTPAPSRKAEMQAFRKAWNEQTAYLEPQSTILRTIREELPDDGILVDELTQVGFASRIVYDAYLPRTYLCTGFMGTLGWGFQTALGAKVAKPDVPVISVAGDGGFMFGVQELATAVQHKIGVILLLFNNNLYGNVRQMQETLYDNRVIATDLHNPDFVKMAHAFGANGVRVNNYADMRKAIQDAKGESLPTVIEVPIGTGLPSTNRFKALPKVR